MENEVANETQSPQPELQTQEEKEQLKKGVLGFLRNLFDIRGDMMSQAQIDEMLRNVASGAAPLVTQKEEEKIKEYDFRAPKKFTKEQIKVLDSIFENYSRLMSSYLRS